MSSDLVFVEMYMGSTVGWVDVTGAGDVYTRDGIRISRGGGAYSQHVDPASCSLTLDNEGGKYSPRNPRSPYYGLIGRNTPLRVWARGQEPYLWIPVGTGSRGRTASSPALDVTTDLDVRIEMSLDRIPQLSSSYAPQVNEVVGRWNATGTPGNRSWRLLLDRLGQPTLGWSTNGDDFNEQFAEEYPVPYVSGQRFALRATLDVDNGAGGHTVRFFTAATLAGPWVQLGPDRVGSGTTSIHPPGDASLELGDINTINFASASGRYYGMELRNGIDGVLLASPDFTAQLQDTFTDAQGNLWAAHGGALFTDFYRRFHGEVSELPTRWHASGNDVHEPVTAAGILRRLRQGAAPLKSTLRRRIPSGGPDGQVPVAYWPMEEGRTATLAYSPLEGVRPLETADLDWASDSGLLGSEALPTLGRDAYISGMVTGAEQGGWHVDLAYRLDELPATERTMLRVYLTASSAAYVQVRVSTAGVRLEVYDSEDELIDFAVFSDAGALAAFTGAWNRLQIFSAVTGGNTYVQAYWRDVITGAAAWVQTVFSSEPGAVSRVSNHWHEDLQGMAIGHLGVWDVGGTVDTGGANARPGITYFDDADDGYEGETAWGRVRRLAEEEDLPLIATGAADASQAMGPQQIATVLENVQQAADVDGGMLIEQRETLGLAYLARETLYNPTPGLVLDYTARGEVMPLLDPTDDDATLANDVTVSRFGGSSARAVLEDGPLSILPPPDGAGVYATSVTVNAASDEQLPNLAAWRLHLGTVDEARYPAVSINLTTAPHLVADVLSLDVGATIRLTNLPDWLPPGDVDLRIEGWTETLGEYQWDITFTCSPASPWVVGTLAAEDGTDGPDQPNRVDTDGSVLAAGTAADDTVLLVRATDGPAWTEDPAEVPWDIQMGGEVARVTAVAPGAFDDFGRTVTDGWGTADSGDVWELNGGTATDYDVTGTHGAITLAADQSTLRFAEIPQSLSDCEQLVSVGVDAVPAAGTAFLPGLFARAVTDTGGATELYWLTLTLDSAGTAGVEVRRTVAVAASSGPLFGWATGDRLWLRMRVDGHRVRGRAWHGDGPEPEVWHVDHVIADEIAEGTAGVTVASTDASTTPTFTFDDYRLVAPQRFTVERGINGVTKSHTAGTDVRLAHPAIVAL